MDENCFENDELKKDVLSKQFTEVPFVRHSSLPLSDETLFRFAQSILRVAANYSYIGWVFSLVKIYVHIYAASLMDLHYMDILNIKSKYQIILTYFFQQPKDEPSLLLCMIISALSFIGILLYFAGYYLEKRHWKLGTLSLLLIYVFGVEILNITSYIHMCQLANMFSQIILGEYNEYIPQFFVQVIIIGILIYINTNNYYTVYNSTFYMSGSGVMLCSPCVVYYSYLTLLALTIIGMKVTLTQLHFKALGFLYVGYGCFFIAKGFYTLYIHVRRNSYLVSCGLVLILEGCFSYTHSLVASPYPGIFIIAILFTSTALNFIVYYILRYIEKRQAKILELAGMDFESLNMKSAWKMSMIFRSGFQYGVPSALTGQFLEWAMHKFNPDNFKIMLFRYASLFKNPPLYMSLLSNDFRVRNNDRAMRFIMYEYDLMNDLRSINKIKPEHLDMIKDISEKIVSFPSLEVLYAKALTRNYWSNFIIIQSLHHMKQLLTNSVTELRQRFPNNIYVMKLCILFESYVEKKPDNVLVLRQQIERLEEESNYYVDKTFTIPFAMFPYTALQIMKQDELELKSVSEEYSYTASSETMAKIPKIEKRYAHHSKRFFILVAFISILFSAITVVFIFNYLSALNEKEQSNRFTEVQFSLLDFSSYFFEKMIMLLPTISRADDKHSLDVYAQSFNEYVQKREKYVFAKLNDPTNNDPCLSEYFDDSRIMVKTPVFKCKKVYSLIFHSYADKFYKTIIASIPEIEADTEDWMRYFVESLASLSCEISRNDIFQVDSSLKYLTCHNKLTVYRSQLKLVLFIAVAVAALAFVIIHILYNKHLFSTFPDTCGDTCIIVAYIGRHYKSFLVFLVTMVVYFAVMLIAVIFGLFSQIIVFKISEQWFADPIEKSVNDIRNAFYAFNTVNSFELYPYMHLSSTLSKEMLIGFINSSISYFFNSVQGSVNLPLTLLIEAVVTSSSANELYADNKTRCVLRDLFSNYVNTTISTENSQNFETRIHLSSQFLIINTVLTELFYFISIFFLYVFFYKVINLFLLTSEIKDLINISIETSENKISSVNSLAHWKYKTGEQFIFETFLKPLCLITDTGIIIFTNSIWNHYFDGTESDFVGHYVEDFIRGVNYVGMISLESGDKIVMIDEQLEERQISQKLEETKQTIIHYRSQIGPKRFAKLTTVETKIDFVAILCMSVHILPEDEEDIVMEGFERVMDILERKLRIMADFDIIKSSSRQITIMLGLNQQISPQVIIMEAVSTAIEFCMDITSDEHENMNLTPACLVTCGDAVFNMNEEDMNISVISGSATASLSELLQYQKHGVVSASKDVIKILEQTHRSHKFQKVLENLYQLPIDPEVNSKLF